MTTNNNFNFDRDKYGWCLATDRNNDIIEGIKKKLREQGIDAYEVFKKTKEIVGDEDLCHFLGCGMELINITVFPTKEEALRSAQRKGLTADLNRQYKSKPLML